MQPKLIIHGGAGSSFKGKEAAEAVRRSLYKVLEEVYSLLLAGASAQAAVVRGCHLLEDNPRFNAGTGSVLQSDGQIRMSASLMDGSTQRFSGVINASRLQHPIELAQALQNSPDRVLSDHGAAELLRELQVPIYDPVTELRLKEWLLERQGNFKKEAAGVVAEAEPTRPTASGQAKSSRDGGQTSKQPDRSNSPDQPFRERRFEQPPQNNGSARTGTIGVVALDKQGHLAAGTSTGGKGFERTGRVSDSAMPAGNYATTKAAVSCTGIGEDIIDECLAARIVVRVTDGLALQAAFERSFAESRQNLRHLGAIGIDATGAIAWAKTSEILLAAYHNGQRAGDTLEMGEGTRVFAI